MRSGRLNKSIFRPVLGGKILEFPVTIDGASALPAEPDRHRLLRVPDQARELLLLECRRTEGRLREVETGAPGRSGMFPQSVHSAASLIASDVVLPSYHSSSESENCKIDP